MLEQCLDYSICLRLWVFSYENQPQQLTDTVALNLSTNSLTEVDMRMPMSETAKGIIKQYLTYLLPNIASLWCLNVAVFFGSAGNRGKLGCSGGSIHGQPRTPCLPTESVYCHMMASVKNNEVSTVATVCAWRSVFFIFFFLIFVHNVHNRSGIN